MDAPDAPTLSPEDFTAKVAEVAQAEKDRKAKAKADRASTAGDSGPKVPDTLTAKVAMMEAILATLRMTDDAERDALMKLSERVAAALGKSDEESDAA